MSGGGVWVGTPNPKSQREAVVFLRNQACLLIAASFLVVRRSELKHQTEFDILVPITLEEMYGSTFLLDDPNWGRFTVPYDFSGSPTISLPCGRNSDGLPLSIQFVGRHLSEPVLCRLGHTFEQTTEWDNLRPNIE